MRAQNPRVRILVAQITPMLPSGCTDCPARVTAYNKAIAAWAPGKSTAASPITVVDCESGFDTATDTTDGVHPNGNGNVKLANCWFEPLKAAIVAAGGGGGGGGSTTLATSTTTTTRAVTVSPSAVMTTRAVTTTSRVVTTTSAVKTTTTTAAGGAGLAQRWGQCGKFC